MVTGEAKVLCVSLIPSPQPLHPTRGYRGRGWLVLVQAPSTTASRCEAIAPLSRQREMGGGRSHQSEAEQRLRYHLRTHRFMGLKFKRQKYLGRCIGDFVCYEHRLIVEVDSGQHAGRPNMTTSAIPGCVNEVAGFSDSGMTRV